jgi:hypothetical protein
MDHYQQVIFNIADKYVQEVVDPTLDENDDETFDDNKRSDDESRLLIRTI